MKFCCASSRVKTSSFPLTNAKSERATLSSFEEEKEDEDAASELLLVLLLAGHLLLLRLRFSSRKRFQLRR